MNVFLYVPNVIGYVRLCLLMTSALYCFSDDDSPQLNGLKNLNVFITCYFLNFVLDGIDGPAARYFDQCTEFGYAFDMILDRIGSSLLFFKLALEFGLKKSSFGTCASTFWLLCMFLDIGSHWLATLAWPKAHKEAHKTNGSISNRVLKCYYGNLFVVCFFSEISLLSILYGNTFIALLCGPIFAIKTFVNVVQLMESSKQLAYKKSEKLI